jgi:hypothetical protein
MIAAIRKLDIRERWFEISVILVTGFAAILYWRGVLPLPALLDHMSA